MNIKKKSIALVMTIFFLCLPITQAGSNDEVNSIHGYVNAVSPFKVKLSEEQIHSFTNFITSMSTVDDQYIAKRIADQILSDDKELDMNQFGGLLREYGLQNVSNYQQTSDVGDDVLNFILQLLIERLGWVYDLMQKTSSVLSNAQRLWKDRSLPKEIISELQLLIENLNELQNLATLLVEGKYGQFLRAWSIGLIMGDLQEVVQSIQVIASNMGIFVGDLSRFIVDVSDFIGWLGANPWEQPIHVYGTVLMTTSGLAGVTIRCRGVTSVTDAAGNFSFFVNSTPDDHSIPPNVYYGIHLCVIAAENNGVVKETPVEFSYVFSDGGIYWLFVIDDDSISQGASQNVVVSDMALWSKLCSLDFREMLRRWIMDIRWIDLFV